MTNKCPNKILYTISKHQYACTWFGVYMLLFLAGVKFDLFFSLVSATVTVITLLVLDRLVRCFLIKKFLRSHREVIYYFVSFALIFVLMQICVRTQIFLFKFLYSHNLIDPHLDMLVGAEEKMLFPFFRTGILLLGTFAISTISFLLSKEKEVKKQTDVLKNEKLDMELRFLKAQINPHFLFNALNNIYSLVYTNDENAAESILKLSEMLRYVTDECQADKISISKEIKYIDNFIDFQLLRMEKHPDIIFNKNITNTDFKIPPMIFQPLVENAFKHSRLENNNSGYVKIELLQNDKQLIFTTENSQQACVFNNQKERSGIGVGNVQKRLELAYGKDFTFNIDNTSQQYKVEIVINLS